MEAAAAAGRAVDRELAAHQLHQVLADRQPEAGAAVAPAGRGVGLREGLEQALLLLGVMPMPVSRTSKRSCTDAVVALEHLDGHDAPRRAR